MVGESSSSLTSGRGSEEGTLLIVVGSDDEREMEDYVGARRDSPKNVLMHSHIPPEMPLTPKLFVSNVSMCI